jgi:hypothetical protein
VRALRALRPTDVPRTGANSTRLYPTDRRRLGRRIDCFRSLSLLPSERYLAPVPDIQFGQQQTCMAAPLGGRSPRWHSVRSPLLSCSGRTVRPSVGRSVEAGGLAVSQLCCHSRLIHNGSDITRRSAAATARGLSAVDHVTPVGSRDRRYESDDDDYDDDDQPADVRPETARGGDTGGDGRDELAHEIAAAAVHATSSSQSLNQTDVHCSRTVLFFHVMRKRSELSSGDANRRSIACIT